MSDERKRLVMLETMIAKGATDPFVHYAHALEFRSLGELPKALEALTSVAERFADYVPTYLMAAQVAAELEKTEVAEQWCKRGLERADGHAAGELQAFLDEL